MCSIAEVYSLQELIVLARDLRGGNRALERDPRLSLVIFIGGNTRKQPEEPRVIDTQHEPPDHLHGGPGPRTVVVVIPIVHLVPRGEMRQSKRI